MDSSSAAGQSLTGVVLAGGYSTRFGEDDKAVAPLGGTPMIRRVVESILEVTDRVVINCREDQHEVIREALADCEERADCTLEYAFDPQTDRGPAAGIVTGLKTIEREYAAVVACDMPFVSPRLLSVLATRAAGRDGAVVKLSDGWYQPTQAVYRGEPMRQACEAVLEAGDGRILSAIKLIDCVILDEDDLVVDDEQISLETFQSIDTQEALREAESQYTEE